jgi:FMN phosphatase YigB (HAD superfamily)
MRPFDTSMHANSLRTNNTDLLRCIDAAEVVSFDIFDTLFVRPLADPEDAFDMLGERFGIDGFRRIRREAQTKAFQQMHVAGQGEITLDGIYACISELPAGVSAASLRQAEIDLELLLTVPNADLIDVFKEVVGRKRVVVVSDMYMPQSFFEAIFDKYALPRVPMYISADRGATKRDHGELFDRVVAETGVRPEKVLHIGDNHLGDVLRARERGLQAFHYINPSAPPYAVSPSLGASIAASMAKLHDRRDAVNTFYGLGYRFGGPAALGLLEWTRDQAVLDVVDIVLFVARDGYVLDQLVQRGHAPGLPPHAYFPGSRVAFALSTINENNFGRWMEFLVSGSYGLSPDEVLGRIGVLAPERKVMEDFGLGDGVIIDIENLGRMREFLQAYRAEIVRTAIRNRRGLFNLLHSFGIRPGMRVAMVDVGWSGTTQETLRDALVDMFDVELVGYYLGLADTTECRRRRAEMPMKALLDSSAAGMERMAKLYERRVGVELMFSAPHEATIGYELQGDGKVRVIEDAGRGADPLALREVVRELQRGMLDFADSYRVMSDGLGYRARAGELAEAVLDFAHMPVEYCDVLYTLKNSDAWGSSRNLSITIGHYSQG